jgi:hypothetical protein
VEKVGSGDIFASVLHADHTATWKASMTNEEHLHSRGLGWRYQSLCVAAASATEVAPIDAHDKLNVLCYHRCL